MRKLLRRRLAASIFSLTALAVAGGWGLSRSPIAGRLVERKLEERLGASVEFDRAAVGITGTTVENLRLHERGSGADSAPFLTVGKLDLNVGAVGAVLDRSPSVVRV